MTITLPSGTEYTGREITVKNLQQYDVNSASNNIVNNGIPITQILPASTNNIIPWATLVYDGTQWYIMQTNF